MLHYNFHLVNDRGIFQIIQHQLFYLLRNTRLKIFFVDNMLRELNIRILQTMERKIYSNATLSIKSESRLTVVIRFIRDNVHKSFHAEELSKIACMSVSNFYRTFKSELGISPVEFINNARIKFAVGLLQD